MSVPVDKALSLMDWVQSLGFDVPELAELARLKKRSGFSSASRIGIQVHELRGSQKGTPGLAGVQRSCTINPGKETSRQRKPIRAIACVHLYC